MVKPIALAEELEAEARRRVAEGFDDESDIVEGIVDQFSEELDEAQLRPQAERLTAAAMAEHLAAQKDWPIPTDCDRLDRAFSALQEAGLAAQQNFTCCQSCGCAEIGEFAVEGRTEGYAFYHMQDTESAVVDGWLFLSYGAMRKGLDPATVGKKIVAALEKEGLRAEWNGTAAQRIRVRLDWRRRRIANG